MEFKNSTLKKLNFEALQTLSDECLGSTFRLYKDVMLITSSEAYLIDHHEDETWFVDRYNYLFRYEVFNPQGNSQSWVVRRYNIKEQEYSDLAFVPLNQLFLCYDENLECDSNETNK